MVKIQKELRLMVGASYDDSGPNVFEQSDRGFYREASLGRPVPQTNIKHSSSEPDIDKFMALVGANGKYVTVLDMALLDVLNSNYRGMIPVVGNLDKTLPVVERFVETFRPERQDKYFKFVDAGENLSLGNTLEKGSDKEGNPTVVFCGDTCLLYDLNPVLDDPDVFDYAATMDLNCRELMFPDVDPSQFKDNGFFPRNYHLIVFDDKSGERQTTPLAVKEPNIYSVNYNQVADLIDIFYGARKSASGKNVKAFFNLILRDKLWKKSIPFFIEHMDLTLETAVKFVPKEILKRIAKTKKETPLLKYHVKLSDLNQLGSMVVGAPVKAKAKHTDPNRLIDIDSYQDWAWIMELFNRAGNPGRIYPYWEQAEKLARSTHELVRAGVKMANPNYINWLFSQHETLRGQEPFVDGVFKSTIWKNDSRVDSAVKCLEKRLTEWRKRTA